MAHVCSSKIECLRLVWVLIGTLLILHPSAVLAQSVSFMPVVTYYSGGNYATSVAVADFNGDGKPDVAVVNFGGGTVGVLLGNGDATFQPVVTYSSGSYWAVGLATADINGDGKPDLLVTTLTSAGSAGVGVLLGNGDGTFKPSVVYGTGGDLDYSLAVGDVNGDGKPDVVATDLCNGCADGAIHVLLGNGDGTLQSPRSYSSGGLYAVSVTIADVNGDGKPDLIVANYCVRGSDPNCANATMGPVADGAVGVLLGNGDGTFQPVVSYNSGGKVAWSVTVADLNGDSKPDLVLANACGAAGKCNSDGSVGVLLGNGDGTFQSALSYDSGGWYAESVAVADVNGDHNPDLIVTNFEACLSSCPDGSVGILLGNGGGTFQAALSYDSGASDTTSVAVADVNGDGRPDLLIADYWGGMVGVLPNNTPFCTTAPTITLSAAPKSLWPPNGKMVPVTVSGRITDSDSGCTVKTAVYVVKDEYGKVQTGGPVTLGTKGAYSFTVSLQASRLETDLDGRLYTVTVRASNNAGKTRSKAGTVIVPHDQGH